MDESGTRTDGGSGMQRYSVPDAAKALGISERAVRGRIERGTLQAERTGSRAWVVLLPEGSGMPAVQSGTPVAGAVDSGTHTVPGSGTTAVQSGMPELLQMLREKDQRIMELAGQLGYVQAQLDETRKLLQAPIDTAAAVPETDARPSPSEDPPAPRLSWWRRLVG